MTIKARLLNKSYGSTNAVVDLSLTASHGGVLGLLGANGAGKSTLIKMLTGSLKPDSGDAEINGCSIVKERVSAQAQIGYLPEAVNGFESLYVSEFLRFVANAKGFYKDAADFEINRIIEVLTLKEVLTSQLGRLSKGWRQRAWLAQAVLGDPPVLFLDEPTDGLDPIQKSAIRAILKRMGRSKTIVMSTHILEEAELLCQDLVIMRHGQIADAGPIKNFLSENGRLEPKAKMLIGDYKSEISGDA